MLPSTAMHLSSHQLAELLIGIAHAQAAALQRKGQRSASGLEELPARLLHDVLNGKPPDAAQVARELERLCQASPRSGGPGPDLDFGAPPP